jgi:IstB-like ATP binding protein
MWSSTFIDDMGLKILPQKSGEILLEIIMRRQENRSTMMTSNRPIEEWGKLLSDVPAASATRSLTPSRRDHPHQWPQLPTPTQSQTTRSGALRSGGHILLAMLWASHYF